MNRTFLLERPTLLVNATFITPMQLNYVHGAKSTKMHTDILRPYSVYNHILHNHLQTIGFLKKEKDAK